MDINQLLVAIGGIMLATIGYFLRSTMSELKEIKSLTYETRTKVEVLEAEYMNKINNLNEKFDMLYVSIKDLTKEISKLNEKIRG